jgi:hypothetical protein
MLHDRESERDPVAAPRSPADYLRRMQIKQIPPEEAADRAAERIIAAVKEQRAGDSK